MPGSPGSKKVQDSLDDDEIPIIDQSLVKLQAERMAKSMEVDKELSQLSRFDTIKAKLGKTDKIVISERRNCLDHVPIPQRLACVTPCFKMSWSLFFTLFLVHLVDCFNFLKFIFLIFEIIEYSANYPEIVKLQVYVKVGILGIITICQLITIAYYKFNFLKGAYAGKLI